MSSSSKTRHSIVPPVVHTGPKPPVHFTSSISIADSAILIGTGLITIHSESVIHPRAKLDSTLGRVSVGRRCIIHERATLGAAPTPPLPSMPIVRGGEGMSVALGDYVIVEVGATVEGGETVIAEGTLIGVGARVGAGAKIGRVGY
jgi:Carbonic anhydrases/acetyltransferases, isoleucine patch superfamily